MRHKLTGPSRAAATACAAGADAIGEAFHLIRGGHADVMVAGGTEACVDAVALAAFGRRAPGSSPGFYHLTRPKTGVPSILQCSRTVPNKYQEAQERCNRPFMKDDQS